MHRIARFDMNEAFMDHVDPRAIEIVKEKIEVYEATKEMNAPPEVAEMYLDILYNVPSGLRLTAGMTTNYRQLKTIYAQRKDHRLPEWRSFCKWIETLPMSFLITGKENPEDKTNILPKVIVISGKARSGKDTVAEMLSKKMETSGSKVLVTHYADLLKYICTKYFDWDGEKDDKGRTLLQYVGTDIVRKMMPSMWVDFIANILTCFSDKWDYVIIPDCRFPNEITRLEDRGFDVTHLNITRPDYESVLSEEQKHHSSETALDNIKPDYTIENNESLQALEEKIDKFIKEIAYGK